MGEGLTAFLGDFAKISNIGAIIVVITCLASMFFYIYRITSDRGWLQGGENGPVMQQTPAQMMGNVYNPFMIKLVDPSKASFEEGVSLEVTHHVPCVLVALWGVNIARVYEVIHQPWTSFLEGFSQGVLHPMLEGHVLYSQQAVHLSDTNERSEVVLHSSDNLAMGSPPRDKYPLVVLILDKMLFMDSETRNESTPRVVAMINLIHVRDAVCPGQSQIISQFVRTPNSKAVFNLQQLYVSGDQADPEATEPSSNGNATPNSDPDSSDGGHLCLICQTHPVNRVALPCRHACVCHMCFPRLDKCPMCRGIISSYFTLSNIDDRSHGECSLDDSFE